MDTARKSSFCSSIIGFGSRVFSDFSGGREEGSRIRAVWNFLKEIVRGFRRDLDFGFSIFNADFGKKKLECDEIFRSRSLDFGFERSFWGGGMQ